MRLPICLLLVPLILSAIGGCKNTYGDTVTPPTPPPTGFDLTIAPGLDSNLDAPTSLDAMSLTFTVNASTGGPAATYAVPWRMTRDGVDGFSSGTVNVASGGSTQVTVNAPATPAGSHTYEVTIDGNNVFDETDDDTNNRSSLTVMVAPADFG